MLADAWATALSVLSVAAMHEIAIRNDLTVRALHRTGDKVEEWLSPAFQRLIIED
jgi:thiamine biosynthesis lipoprotein